VLRAAGRAASVRAAVHTDTEPGPAPDPWPGALTRGQYSVRVYAAGAADTVTLRPATPWGTAPVW
jgi:hypothetical protein